MSSPYAQAVPEILAQMEQDRAQDNQPQPMQEIDLYIQQEGDEQRITYIRKLPQSGMDEPRRERSVNSFLLYVGYLAACWLLLVIPSSTSLAAEPIVTVTIVPKTQTITTTQSITLPARLFPPLTLSQSQTVQTTGHGYQSATHASGYIIFYNGLFTSQTIAAGTIVTASSGVQIETDQSAIIPAANPPGLGETTIAAHAVTTGAQGNIPAYDINELCCTTAVKAVNIQSFTGGQDERYFSTVSAQDINKLSTQLIATLSQSMQGAFTAQLTPAEALIPPLCSEKNIPDHQAGAEATTVTVTVSETCSAGAYEKQTLQEQARQLLTASAREQLGAGYSLVGDMHYQLVHAAMQQGRAILQITCSGLWMYQLTSNDQQRLVHLIAGKPKGQAIRLLLAVPGIQAVTITGIAANAILPTDPSHIQIIVS